MHVLVTDAAGVVGRMLARQLLAAGHTVSGIGLRPDERLDPNVEFACASLHGPALTELAAESDVVIHLAPVDDGVPGSAGLAGVAHVTHAAARAGARLLFVSQVAGRPELYRPAEALVTTGWSPSLVVRIAPPLGRQLDWMVCRTVASVLRGKVSERPIRVLHLDDLVRFLVYAVSADRSGVVDLATPDTTNVVTAWRLIRSVDPRRRLHGVASWENLIPDVDITAAQEDWNFEYGWQALGALVDTCRGLIGRKLDPAGAVTGSGALPLPVEGLPRLTTSSEMVLRSVAPDGLEGEFDDRIDPRFPVFSGAGLTEALPGPLTPVTLDVQLGALRAAGHAMGRVLALGDVVAEEWSRRAIAVFGHRPYVGVSANVAAASQLPGWDGQAIAQQTLGAQPPDADLLPFGRPQLAGGARRSAAKVVVTARSLALLRNLRADTEAYVSAATAEHLDAGQLAAVPDAGLDVRIRLLRDRIEQGWILTALWVIDNGVTAATLRPTRAGCSVSGLGAIMESTRVAAETAELATVLQGDATLCALAREGNTGSIRALSPAAGAALDKATARLGHRGRAEAELASPTFGDEPGLLLQTVVETAAGSCDSVTTKSAGSLPQRLADSARNSRELAHDTTIRFTHELRMTLREMGSRRATADLIDSADDVFYLVCDELVTMPADVRLRVKRRRAERERLQAQHLPDVIDRTWNPNE